VTLWYRSPELLLGGEEYDEGVDIWAVGVILGELLSGGPLFPVKDELGALAAICDLLGSPDERSWKVRRNVVFFIYNMALYPDQKPYTQNDTFQK
jgi:serine/threonine protein kinase